jgi:glycosyltransferase involved in cell wall biosynthesis
LRATRRWSIGIAPLEDTPFNRVKSHLKYLDYSALGIASICSDADPYRTTVESGANGLLVPSDSASWYYALRLLIEDEALRKRLASRAYEDVRRRHVLEVKGGQWLEAYTDLLATNVSVPALPHRPAPLSCQPLAR